MGVSCAGVFCTGFGLLFFFAEVLVTDETCVADVGSDDFETETETGSGIGINGAGSDVGSGTKAGSGSFLGEAVAELASPAFGGFLFSGLLRSSLHQFWDNRWFWTGPNPDLFLSSPWLAAHWWWWL